MEAGLRTSLRTSETGPEAGPETGLGPETGPETGPGSQLSQISVISQLFTVKRPYQPNIPQYSINKPQKDPAG